MGRNNLLLWFVISWAPLACAQAQKPEFASPDALPFFVRLERDTPGNEVCAIVREDGLFHVERDSGNQVEVSEGALDEAELGTLRADLSNKDLAALTQGKILPSLGVNERDVFQLGILRPAFTQNLRFPDRESRIEFDKFLNPLLRWLSVLQKHPHATLDAYKSRSNCLPPHKIEFSARSGSGEVPTASAEEPKSTVEDSRSPASPAIPFLMRLQVDYIGGQAAADWCVVVYPSGQFRVEKVSQVAGEKTTVHAFEKALDKNELKQLQELLNEPKLKSSTHQSVSGRKYYRGRTLTTLTVPRQGRTQQLIFASYVDKGGLRLSEDPEESLIKSLAKWITGHIDNKKGKELRERTATRCEAQPQPEQP